MLIWDRNNVPEAFTWLDGLLFCGVFERAYGISSFHPISTKFDGKLTSCDEQCVLDL